MTDPKDKPGTRKPVPGQDPPTETSPTTDGDASVIEPRRRGIARTITKAGYGTRRQAEEMVRSGRVHVSGKRILDPGFGIGLEDEISIDGKLVVELIRNYLAFNKPLDVATSATVTHRTRLITEFLPRDILGLAPAGRLDPSTSGLLLVSNDNAWNALAASGNGHNKEFVVTLDSEITEDQVGVIAGGVQVPKSGLFKPDKIWLDGREEGGSRVRLLLREGKVRHIRNLMTALRIQIVSIHREKIGPVSVEGLLPGRWRMLNRHEIEAIRMGAKPSSLQS